MNEVHRLWNSPLVRPCLQEWCLREKEEQWKGQPREERMAVVIAIERENDEKWGRGCRLRWNQRNSKTIECERLSAAYRLIWLNPFPPNQNYPTSMEWPPLDPSPSFLHHHVTHPRELSRLTRDAARTLRHFWRRSKSRHRHHRPPEDVQACVQDSAANEEDFLLLSLYWVFMSENRNAD